MDTQKINPQKENAITEGVIWKQILLFFFPILFGTFFQQLYNAADALIVGRFVGKEALSAVGGGTGTVINLLVGFFVGLASGATVIISQYYGAKREEMVGYAVHTAMAFSLVGGLTERFSPVLSSMQWTFSSPAISFRKEAASSLAIQPYKM